jgi:ketosteroid isomerase-like protein
MALKPDPVKSELLAWHDRFAACVRDRDFAGGSALVAPGCVGFGTFVEFAAGRDRLIRDQWTPVWSTTHGFHFLPEPFECIVSPDGALACVATCWESSGHRLDGGEFLRRGRCTTLLERGGGNPTGWVAVHTHYSKSPAAEI